MKSAIKGIAACIASYFVSLLLRYALGMGFASMFEAWGITTDNIYLAPAWAVSVLRYHGQVINLMQAAIIVVASMASKRWLLQKPHVQWGTGALRGAFIGAAVGVIVLGGLLLLDGVRMGWRVSQVRLSGGVFIGIGAYALMAIAYECLFRDLIFSSLDQVHPLWAMGISAALFSFADTSVLFGVGQMNALLLGIVLGFIYRKTGSIATGSMLWFSLNAIRYPIMGSFGSVDGMVSGTMFELYPAQLNWLSGGQWGPQAGLMMTAVLLAVIGLFIWQGRKPMAKT